jgi:hypothetical protein
MTSGGRRGFPWKGLLALLALVLVIWLVIEQFSGSDESAPSGPATTDDVTTDAAGDASAKPALPARTELADGSARADAVAPPTRAQISTASLAAAPTVTQGTLAPTVQTVRTESSSTSTGAATIPPAQPPAGPVSTSTASTPTPAPAPPTSNIARQVSDALTLAGQGNRIKARAQLSRLLFDTPGISAQDEKPVRQALDDLNADLLFSRQVASNDPLAIAYQVQPGDRLINIGNRQKVPYQFIELINNVEARRLQAGQNLKLIRGPIHARVSKSRFVMDMFAVGSDGAPVYLTSFPVGLGENDGTPPGRWKIGSGKVTNPDWRNPRTGEYFTADNHENPIGEYWIPMEGVEGASVGRTGFGIHGTIDPDSIGKMKSMGCIRLADADIAMVYNMLFAGESMVDVVE